MIRSEQNAHNPMDVSSSMDATTELNRPKQKAEQEKHLIEEKLAKTSWQKQKPNMNKLLKTKTVK